MHTKQKINLATIAGVVIAMLALLFMPVMVSAQEDVEATNPEAELMMTTTAVEEDGDSEQSNNGRSQDRAARLQEYKEKNAERLSQAKQNRLVARCKNAQTKIATLSQNVATVTANRQSVYTGVVERLKRLSESLVAANVDTTALDSAIAELESKQEAYAQIVDAYQLTLTDLAEMDCEADPEAFQAALTAARNERQEVFKSSQEMRTFIQDSIKPILTTIRQSLGDDNDAETETENTEQTDTTEEQ